jgi:hypothetical protein
LLVRHVAHRYGINAGYGLVASFCLIGAVAMVIWTMARGVEAAIRPLESLVGGPTPALAEWVVSG